MGDIKKNRKKYSKPRHPWQKNRIDEEKKVLKEYGLKNKKEIWRLTSMLSKYKARAKKLITLKTKQADKERNELLTKLASLGLLEKKSQVDQVLSLSLKDILARRLQTVIVKKKMAKSIKQSRQFIVHGHVIVGNKKVTSPSYLVLRKEEESINFAQKSSLLNAEHPERLKE